MYKLFLAIVLGALFLPMLGGDTPHANGLPVLAISAIAAVFMVIGAAILYLGHGSGRRLNVRVVVVDTGTREPGAVRP